MKDNSFEDSYEHDELLEEIRKQIKLQIEVFQQDPAMMSSFAKATRAASHICFLCRHKRLFMQCIQVGALLNTLATNKRLEMQAVFNAARIPATLFEDPGIILSYATDFLKWQYEPDKYGMPAWYTLGQQEWDGHE